MEWVKKHKTISVVIAIFILIVLGNAIGGKSSTTSTASQSTVVGNQSATTTQPPPSTTTSTQPIPRIGQPTRSGNFQFTVNNIKCGIPQVGSGFTSESAQGQYCLLDVTVENAAKTSHSFDATVPEYLFNSSGDRYSLAVAATIDEAPSGNQLYADINPGNSIKVVFVFDIPKGQTPVTAELQSGYFSKSVKIALA